MVYHHPDFWSHYYYYYHHDPDRQCRRLPLFVEWYWYRYGRIRIQVQTKCWISFLHRPNYHHCGNVGSMLLLLLVVVSDHCHVEWETIQLWWVWRMTMRLLEVWFWQTWLEPAIFQFSIIPFAFLCIDDTV